MASVDTLTSKDCRINWELLESIQNNPLCDMASCFVQCIYTYNKLTEEFADIKRVLENSEAMNKSLSEKCYSIESSKKAECKRLEKIIYEQEYSIQTLTATFNEISLKNGTINSSHKNHIGTVATENNETMQADKTLQNEQDTPVNSQLSTEFMSDDVISINDTVNEINETPQHISRSNDNRCSQTPTGRTSPIITAKKIKPKIRDNVTKDSVNSNRNLSSRSPKRNIKKLKQSRLTFSEVKPSKLLDVSHSKSFCGGTRNLSHKEKDEIKNTPSMIAPEDNEVILPSPTSDITRLQFHSMSKRSLKSMTKPSPQNIITDMTMIKAEVEPEDIHNDADATNCLELEPDQQMESGKSMAAPLIKLNPTKSSATKKKSPLCLNKNANNIAKTYTQYNTNVSMSLLDGQHVGKENIDFRIVKEEDTKSCMVKQEDTKSCMVKQEDTKSCMVKQEDTNSCMIKQEDTNSYKARDQAEQPEFIYREDPVRKKAEKRKLLGWSCNNCKEYYGEAYKDDEERLEKAKQVCSKHRGRFNPEKSATPPGFWNIRFSPPEDTEDFNRQNGV